MVVGKTSGHGCTYLCHVHILQNDIAPKVPFSSPQLLYMPRGPSGKGSSRTSTLAPQHSELHMGIYQQTQQRRGLWLAQAIGGKHSNRRRNPGIAAKAEASAPAEVEAGLLLAKDSASGSVRVLGGLGLYSTPKNPYFFSGPQL